MLKGQGIDLGLSVSLNSELTNSLFGKRKKLSIRNIFTAVNMWVYEMCVVKSETSLHFEFQISGGWGGRGRG